LGFVHSACHLDLIGRIEEQLGRFGVAGRVELEGSEVRLMGHGRRIAMAFGELETYPDASPDQQARILDRIVRELVRLRRAQSPSVAPGARSFDWLRPIVIVVLMGMGLWLAWRWLGKPARDAVVTRERDQNPPNGVPIAARAVASSALGPGERCQRVQARIATGGSVSLLDVDGWVVELMLLSADPAFGATSPKLDAFLAKPDDDGSGRRMVWSEDEELRVPTQRHSFVVVSEEPLVDVVAGTKAGVRITWSGAYVGKYFDEAGRLHMQRLAAAMYEATGANYGALYARCIVGFSHQVGSWFRGQDLPAAALSMIAAMGLYAEVAHVDGADPRTANPIEQRRAWDNLVDRAKRLDRQRLTLALSEDGGMVASRPGSWVTLSFPFLDANRATRASLRIARSLGVAPRH
jgi:hypothetical protein